MTEAQEAQEYLNFALWGVLFLYTFMKLLGSIKVVQTQTVRILERFGRFHRPLEAGFYVTIPWVDKVAAVHDLREQTVDVPPQQCFTLDNVRVVVDGVMYIQVTDPIKATYGVTDYRTAAMQLALTTSRSIIATLELDKTFEERDLISARVVEEVARAGASWGINVLRYEIKGIEPPDTVKHAMELQVTAERDRRAIIARSEGEMQSNINRSEGARNEMVARSEGEKQRRINEAEGRAREILALAEATAESVEKIADALSTPGGAAALRLRISEAYLDKLGALGRPQTQIVLPANLTSLSELLKAIELDGFGEAGPPPRPEPTRPEAPPVIARPAPRPGS